jgi:hypothetical protein
MTVGIGVLATSAGGRQNSIIPDSVVLIADTLGSFADDDSHGRLHKAFMFPDARMYAVSAGSVDRAAELLPIVANFITGIPKPQRTFGRIAQAVAAGCYGYKHDKFTVHEFPKLRLPPEAMDPNKVTPELNAFVHEHWTKFSIGCDLIIAVFDHEGKVALLQVCGDEHELHNIGFPGFGAIGVGATNAIFWLSQRQHTLGLLPLRAAYHAYEAKLMAESSPHVNKHLDIIVAKGDDHWFSTTHSSLHPEKEHPEINPKNLKKMLKRYGPHDTSKIGA